jgi:hypothetical protein
MSTWLHGPADGFFACILNLYVYAGALGLHLVDSNLLAAHPRRVLSCDIDQGRHSPVSYVRLLDCGAAGDGADGSHNERTARLMVLCVRMICNIDKDGNRKSTCSGAEDEQRGHVALLLGALAAGFVWTPV